MKVALKFPHRTQFTNIALLALLLASSSALAAPLEIRQDESADTLSVFREGEDQPILTQNARSDFRPFIHPIVAPDGRGELTRASHGDNPHQTGLYWGFTRVNGRDFFHNPGAEHWRRISVTALKSKSSEPETDVQWQTVYDLLGDDGEAVLRQTQTWTMREQDDSYILDLHWSGTALTDVTIGQDDYGGLFLRMPWSEGMNASVRNSIRKFDQRAEGHRAVWLDIGMQVEGRDDRAHIAIFDHPDNPGYPQPWRVDGGFGVGPARARLGDWQIANGETAQARHRLVVYTGELTDVAVTALWSQYAGGNRTGVTDAEWDLAELDQFAQWDLADMETVRQAYRAKFLTPEKSVEAMTITEGFEVKAFASEPMITQPMAFCFDDRGRLWIAQNHEYKGIGGGVEFTGDSRILILEDTDRDGVADKRTVFLEDVSFPSAIAVGFGGLWLGSIPNLLFVPDRDGDDRADVEDIEVRLTGWGQDDLHEILNSFHWGPDGWLYGCQGVFTPSRVGKPAGRSREYRLDASEEGVSGEVATMLAHPEQDAPFDTVAAAFAAGGNFSEQAGQFCLKLPTEVKAGDRVTVTAFGEDGEEVDLSKLRHVEIGFGEAGAIIDDNDSLDTSSGNAVFTLTAKMLASDYFDFFAVVPPGGGKEVAFEYEGEPQDINGGVWRYHPIKDRFEVVAHGFSNPWGIDYDARGQFFITACVIPHLWHVIPGGVYLRQSGSHYNPHVYSPLRTIADHRHRSAHGGAQVYQSDAFPEKYRGQLFMNNIHEHAVLTDVLEPKGSGFVGRHGDDFMLANNAQFVGFSTQVGPEGAVYVLDWHDSEICGGPPRTTTSGRVYRILPTESQANDWDGRYGDLSTMTNGDLVELQRSPSAWHARRARLILQARAAEDNIDRATITALEKIFRDDSNVDHRLRALWALHVTNSLDDSDLLGSLIDREDIIRAWAIQLLCEDRSPSSTALESFVALSGNDPSPVVRLYLASALQRMGPESRWPIANQLVAHEEDADDHNIPNLIWFGIESVVAENAVRALELASRSRIPMVTRHIARRLTAEGTLTELVEEIGRNAETRNVLLLGMRDGLDGQFDVVAPANWASVYGQLHVSEDASAPIALEISLKFGDEIAARALLETLKSPEAAIADRRRALRGLADRQTEALKPTLLMLLDDDRLRRDAIRATAAFDNEALGKALLDRYADWSAEDRLEVVHAMASRPGYGAKLTQAIQNGDVLRSDVPSYVARILFRVVGNRFLEIWGPVETLTPEKQVALAKTRALLTNDALDKADRGRGHEVFKQRCAACHQMHGEGGKIGPDLTGANRTDLEYLLSNILTPSAIVQDDYKMRMVHTKDGRFFSGVVVSEDDRQLRLRIANEEPVAIARSQIADLEVSELSMMPEGLLNGLTDQQVVELFAYLRSLEPVTAPGTTDR